jgi:hypothetical protein
MGREALRCVSAHPGAFVASSRNLTLIPPQLPEAPRFRAAYLATLPELEAISGVNLPDVTLDVRAAVTTVLGALPNLAELRPRIAT